MTWTPVAAPAESWTSLEAAPRVFDPFVFDRAPIFDTGVSLSGIWSEKLEQQEVWTPE